MEDKVSTSEFKQQCKTYVYIVPDIFGASKTHTMHQILAALAVKHNKQLKLKPDAKIQKITINICPNEDASDGAEMKFQAIIDYR